MRNKIKNCYGLLILIYVLNGCATSPEQITSWERNGNTKKLSEVTRDKEEEPRIRRLSLESLARLNWKPSNEERLQVYNLFASQAGYKEATELIHTITAEQFVELDKKVVACAKFLNNSGNWINSDSGRIYYNELRSANGKAVKIALCQQLLAHPELQTRIVLLAIKLGISGSETELVGVLFQYGDMSMAEDYLNSSSSILNIGGRKWASANGYTVEIGQGSHRSTWGQF
jgi:hypothetical protein